MPRAIHFFTTESAPGSKRAWTPEGFLLCSGVAVARTGTLMYGRGEIPVQADTDGIIRIERTPEEVFHSNAILSFAGKPVTDEHPPAKVSPDNWKRHSIGTVLNPHRGEVKDGENNLILYADLLIQDRRAIQDVMNGKREVSAGYDAEYEQIAPGQGAQHNIIGNHVALVERGRCGPICSIGDAATIRLNSKGNSIMSRKNVRARQIQAFKDSIMQAFETGDEDALVDTLERVPEMMGNTSEGGPVDVGGKGSSGGTGDEMGGTHVHIHTNGESSMRDVDDPHSSSGFVAPPAGGAGGDPSPDDDGGDMTLEALASRIDQLEQAVAILAQGDDDNEEEEDPDNLDDSEGGKPPGTSGSTGDRRRASVGDSTSMSLVFQEVIQRAELLNPGGRYATFDASKPAKATAATMCTMRRNTLNAALNKGDDAKDAIMAVAGNPNNPSQYIKQMSCDAVQAIFNGSSEMIRTAGLRAAKGGQEQGQGTHYGNSAVLSVADTVANMNKINRERYGITGR